MNEKINTLAEQADLYARSDNSSMLFENFQKRYTEKLAELIIRECAQVGFDYADGHCCEISAVILEHFGVKE